MRILNVGGGACPVPPDYVGAEVAVLDLDPAVNPTYCFDARELAARASEVGEFDVVYSSHFLEHVYAHEVAGVLNGFRSVLNTGGKLDLIVPNLRHAIQTMLERGLEPTDTYYRAASGPVTFHDVLYGWDQAMSKGNLFYAHKCGFTPATLGEALAAAGFVDVGIADAGHNIMARASCP